jgi:rSAM/selenodomain-associated transferase 1
MSSLNRSAAIAIFVKTPGLSPVKTRLAKTLGSVAAESAYRLSVKAIEQTVKTVDADSYFAVAEQAGLKNSLWQGLECLQTGPGCLGQRQHHIYQTLLRRYQQVILIGSDSPQLTAIRLQQAIEALKTEQFVMGPARDGGYYLFAGKCQLSQTFWTNLSFSRADTCDNLLAALPAKAHLLAPLTDLDTVEDIPQLHSELTALGTTLNPQQRAVISWIETLKN